MRFGVPLLRPPSFKDRRSLCPCVASTRSAVASRWTALLCLRMALHRSAKQSLRKRTPRLPTPTPGRAPPSTPMPSHGAALGSTAHAVRNAPLPSQRSTVALPLRGHAGPPDASPSQSTASARYGKPCQALPVRSRAVLCPCSAPHYQAGLRQRTPFPFIAHAWLSNTRAVRSRAVLRRCLAPPRLPLPGRGGTQLRLRGLGLL